MLTVVPLIINSNERLGGAARAAERLHRGLLEAKIDSQYLVDQKSSDSVSVLGPQSTQEKIFSKLNPYFDRLPVLKYRDRGVALFSPAWARNRNALRINRIEADIAHFHWITDGFLRIESYKRINRPIIWTLHDMWPFTGGCHYSNGCDSYRGECGKCPLLDSKQSFDLSRKVHNRKAKSWEKLNLTIISPSRWLAARARESSLFRQKRIEIIPNGIDVRRFQKIEKRTARKILGLSEKAKILLFGAESAVVDKRKGYEYLQAALMRLKKIKGRSLEILIFGTEQVEKSPEHGIKTHCFGRLRDDLSMSILFSAADVFVAPSIEENLSNTVMESLSCGTPCVAFNIGGMPDMIESGYNGYLARPLNSEDLAKGIEFIIGDRNRHKQLGKNARNKVLQCFNIETIVKRHMELYNDILLSNGISKERI